MAKPVSFNKRELEKKREKKRKEKQQRKEERKAEGGTASFEEMIAYVDENGMITDTPPDLSKRQEVDVDDITVSIPKKEKIDDPILKGRVEHFNTDKGYGFIKNLNNTEKYFFHVSNAFADISERDMVTFELEKGQRGLNAVRIILVE